MKNKVLIAGLLAFSFTSAPATYNLSYAAEQTLTQSARWIGTGDRWQVSDGAGGYLKNCWFQDDITNHWYLLGAEDGSVMYSGLITDQSTGKTYLLNTNHDGTYGRMLTVDGTYNLNGKSVYLTFNQNHDGTYGAITSGLSDAQSSGISSKQLNSIPTDKTETNSETGSGSNTQTGGSNTYGQDGVWDYLAEDGDYDGMPAQTTEQSWYDFNGDGKLTGGEYQVYLSSKTVKGEASEGVHIN